MIFKNKKMPHKKKFIKTDDGVILSVKDIVFIMPTKTSENPLSHKLLFTCGMGLNDVNVTEKQKEEILDY